MKLETFFGEIVWNVSLSQGQNRR